MSARAAELAPTSFGGRYTLLRQLAVGGMAEIYLARQAAMAGFEKEVVIKRLRHELADDPRIVEMFLDEARIGALLNHPNIVHVYDVDEHDGLPYIAMEYIVGEELNELCRRGITLGRFLPLEHAVELIRQAAAGMGFYHAKRGPEGTAHVGQPLDIVHLDISPSNLLVTQDGFLKVIDFGIARARGQRTRSEVIPGKLSYMSPEQAARSPVDHRSDIFSLGIVLYEITVGRRLFRGPANEVVQKLIDARVEPPTFTRRTFPPALESIVMRCLEKHPGDRYQSAYDLADDLEAFLRDERLHSGPVRIARYLDMLTHAAGGPRRPELVSEVELRRDGDELDFDTQVFDSYKPPDGAPRPEEAPDWEDADQPDADVAAALGLELAELRALRTPVPGQPAGGELPSSLARPAGPVALRDDAARPADVATGPSATAADDRDVTAPPEMTAAETSAPPVAAAEPEASAAVAGAPPPGAPPPAAPVAAVPSHGAAAGRGPAAAVPAPSLGGGPRASTSGAPVATLPWVLVVVLGVAVIALVAYIVGT